MMEQANESNKFLKHLPREKRTPITEAGGVVMRLDVIFDELFQLDEGHFIRHVFGTQSKDVTTSGEQEEECLFRICDNTPPENDVPHALLHTMNIASAYSVQAMNQYQQGNESIAWSYVVDAVKWLGIVEAVSSEKLHDRIRASVVSKKLNDARHSPTRSAMNKAIEEWAKDPARFSSAEKAGLYFADWLAPQGFKYEPRTVTGWIRAHAKRIGIRFR
jgi:hypothetical protein